jgi:hypothetical protein
VSWIRLDGDIHHNHRCGRRTVPFQPTLSKDWRKGASILAKSLRLVDTALGVAVGVAAAWLGTYAMRVTKLFGRDNSPKAHGEERA